MKELARDHNQLTYLQQVLFFEKKIEALYITRSMQDRADQLSSEADEVNAQLSLISQVVQSFSCNYIAGISAWSCPK